MTKIKDYVVITSSKGVESFEALIKQNIQRGWQPFGGVAVISAAVESEDGTVIKAESFAQAMVLYDTY